LLLAKKEGQIFDEEWKNINIDLQSLLCHLGKLNFIQEKSSNLKEIKLCIETLLHAYLSNFQDEAQTFRKLIRRFLQQNTEVSDINRNMFNDKLHSDEEIQEFINKLDF
jgi:hypothetical protein